MVKQTLVSSLGIINPTESMYEALKGEIELPIFNVRDVDIAPASMKMQSIDSELIGEAGSEFILKEIIENINNKYDFILIDCPPSLGLLTINALVASDEILIPVEAEPLALSGMAKILEITAKVQKRLNPKIKVLGLLVTKYDKRKTINKNIKSLLDSKYPEWSLSTYIRDNVAIAEAPSRRLSIIDYAPKSNGAEDYSKLANEIIKKTK